MKNEDPTLPATSPALTRRAALQRALTFGLAAAILPASEACTPQAAAAEENTFIPEDDYPYFGHEPELLP